MAKAGKRMRKISEGLDRERLYPLAGANGLAEANPFQRALRDIHACCAHIALTWDVQAANYGGVLLGRPSSDPKL